jgi:hypothetical protein
MNPTKRTPNAFATPAKETSDGNGPRAPKINTYKGIPILSLLATKNKE